MNGLMPQASTSNISPPLHVEWEVDDVGMPVDTITVEKKRELVRAYKRNLKGKTRLERRHEWLVYLAARYQAGGNHMIFMNLRHRARAKGMALCKGFLSGQWTRRQYFIRIRRQCADLYATQLNAYGLALIDLSSQRYLNLTETAAIEGLHAFRGMELDDNTVLCRAAAKLWYRFVETLHAEYGLPNVASMRRLLGEEGLAEQFILRKNSFETMMTPQQRADWRQDIGL